MKIKNSLVQIYSNDRTHTHTHTDILICRDAPYIVRGVWKLNRKGVLTLLVIHFVLDFCEWVYFCMNGRCESGKIGKVRSFVPNIFMYPPPLNIFGQIWHEGLVSRDYSVCLLGVVPPPSSSIPSPPSTLPFPPLGFSPIYCTMPQMSILLYNCVEGMTIYNIHIHS